MFSPPLAAAGHWLDDLIYTLASCAPNDSFFGFAPNLRGMLALVLVSLSCGAVGSLVVGSRMAFFSDALAHCAFASVSIGFGLFVYFAGQPDENFWAYVTPVMLVFGVCIGFSIAAVRERTGLASDTVIGVFFAAAVGLAALLRKLMQKRALFSLEDFLFGDPMLLRGEEVVHLGLLLVAVGVVLALTYNHLLLYGFSPSLALARGAPARLASYAFVMLLALVVNLCVRSVGVLLINALLVVPAAAAANVCRNLRQLFWLTIALCLLASLGGQLTAWHVEVLTGSRLGVPGAVVLFAVALFVLCSLLGPRWRDRAPAPPAAA
jgi:zinc transport system permease protein